VIRSNNFQQVVLLTAGILANQAVFAHTSFETRIVEEGTRIMNNVTIGHACGPDTRVIGTSVVFADGISSSVVADGLVHDGPFSDFVTNWGSNIQPLYSRAVFNEVEEKQNELGNVVGFWGGGGPGMANNMLAYLPFRVNATNINPESCAVSVKVFAAIADICKITPEADVRMKGIANFWASSSLQTLYDSSEGGDTSASITFTRNLEKNPLPASCGAGITVELRPSAAQINRDMPIQFQGVQVWPAK